MRILIVVGHTTGSTMAMSLVGVSITAVGGEGGGRQKLDWALPI